jgi:hypothetical protein
MKLINGLQLTTVALCLAFFAGCETTGDPNTGGLAWSETKARERLASRESETRSAQQQAASARQQTAQLKEQKANAEASTSAQRRELAQLDNEIADLRHQISSGGEAVQGLEGDLARLEQQSAALSSQPSTGSAEKERELENLRTEVNRLKNRIRLQEQTR